MSKKEAILKRMDEANVGSSDYHFACADLYKLMSEEAKDPEVKANYLDCRGLHKLMGELFKK